MADKASKDERDPTQPSPSQYEQDMVKLGLRPGIDKTPEPVVGGPAVPVPDTHYDKVLAGKATDTSRKPFKGRSLAIGQSRAAAPVAADAEKPKT